MFSGATGMEPCACSRREAKLAAYRPSCLGLDVELLYADTLAWRRALAMSGPDRMGAETPLAFPEIRVLDATS